MEIRKQASNEPELRYCTEPEARVKATNEETRTIRGYGVVFNKKSHPLIMDGKRFIEVIAPEAVKGVDFSRNISLFNHNMDIPLASVESGTMRVGTDNLGVWYEADLPPSPDGDNVWQNVKRGVVRGSSFQFDTAENGDEWEVRSGVLYRTVKQFAGIYEQGPVVNPAYPDTTAAQRSFEKRGIAIGAEQRSEKWDLAYLVESNAYAISAGNDMVMRLNIWAENMERDGLSDMGIDAEIAAIAAESKAAKASLLKLIDLFADVVKKANANEKRDLQPTQQARTAQIAAILALQQ